MELVPPGFSIYRGGDDGGGVGDELQPGSHAGNVGRFGLPGVELRQIEMAVCGARRGAVGAGRGAALGAARRTMRRGMSSAWILAGPRRSTGFLRGAARCK